MKFISDNKRVYVFMAFVILVTLGTSILMLYYVRILENKTAYEEVKRIKIEMPENTMESQVAMFNKENTTPRKQKVLSDKDEPKNLKVKKSYPRKQSAKSTTDDWMFKREKEIEEKLKSEDSRNLATPAE